MRTVKAGTESTATFFSDDPIVFEESESKGTEEFAALIWNYVKSSEHLVQELDVEVGLLLLGQRNGGEYLVSKVASYDTKVVANEWPSRMG